MKSRGPQYTTLTDSRLNKASNRSSSRELVTQDADSDEEGGKSRHPNSSGSDSDGGPGRGSKSPMRHPPHPSVCEQGPAHYLRTTLSELVLGSKMNILLVFTPFAFAAKFTEWGEAYVFTFALLALVPFAERVSFVTEDVAKYTNETLGGLLNASFGNVTELVICFFALQEGLVRVVQMSMLGSVLSNLLLVLGSAFLVGGTRHKEQRFNKVAAVTNSGLLIVSVLALSLPSVLDATHTGMEGIRRVPQNATAGSSWLTARGSLSEEGEGGDAPLWLSRIISALLLVLYALMLLFQLQTHTYLFEGASDDEDDEPPILGFWGGVFWLAFITAFISSLSDMIVDTIEGASASLNVPIIFMSGILVPIVGNAAEHAAALIFAWRNKMEICLGSAMGSAVQISVLVIPLCVMMGWAMGTRMTLNFHIFETCTLLIASMGCSFTLMDGRSHWLKGVILVFSYFMIAAAFWAHANPTSMT
mmetsp:Transcript_54727/g.123188  ORF Transcript_54727/g.123188 Transcript_54727/m.123188 type:complete len:475 (-) Transcript_54727:171-1595(-)